MNLSWQSRVCSPFLPTPPYHSSSSVSLPPNSSPFSLSCLFYHCTNVTYIPRSSQDRRHPDQKICFPRSAASSHGFSGAGFHVNPSTIAWGEKIEANVRQSMIPKFKAELRQGKVYKITYFAVVTILEASELLHMSLRSFSLGGQW